MIKEKAAPEVKDAGLIAAAQRVEHYEIAAYGTACTFAHLLGHAEAEVLLQEDARRGKGNRRETDRALRNPKSIWRRSTPERPKQSH